MTEGEPSETTSTPALPYETAQGTNSTYLLTAQCLVTGRTTGRELELQLYGNATWTKCVPRHKLVENSIFG